MEEGRKEETRNSLFCLGQDSLPWLLKLTVERPRLICSLLPQPLDDATWCH